MHVPFTYKLRFDHPELACTMWYYGSKTAKVCHPDDLWTKYFTSSKHVKKYIELYGLECFTIEEIVVHPDAKTAREFEVNFLTSVNAALNPDWINQHNGGAKFSTAGKKHSAQSIQKIIATRTKNGTLNTMSPESIEKIRQTKLLNGTMNTRTPEAVRKTRQTKLLNGTMNSNSPSSNLLRTSTKILNGKMKQYLIVSPGGSQTETTNLHGFCKDSVLSPDGLARVARGLQAQHKGWQCYIITPDNTPELPPT